MTTVYTIAFVMLSTLIPCLWVSYIWDQTIDPHYDYEARAIQVRSKYSHCTALALSSMSAIYLLRYVWPPIKVDLTL